MTTLFRTLIENKRIIDTAGTIPYYIDENNDVHVYLMIPSNPDYGGTQPQLAKGQIDDGYTVKETAAKEAKEEVGLKLTNLKFFKKLNDFKYIDGKMIAVYYAEVKDINDFNDPHWESKWSGWINLSKDFNVIRPEQKHIFKYFSDVISGI